MPLGGDREPAAASGAAELAMELEREQHVTNRDLAASVFRVWGVIWLASYLIALTEFLNAAFRHAYRQPEAGMEAYLISSQWISIGCGLIAAIFLITKAGWLARIVSPTDGELSLSLNARELQGVLFSVVALYFILDGARHAVGGVYHLLARPRGDSANTFGYVWRAAPEDLVRALAGIIAGLWVFFARRPGGLLSGIRGAYESTLGLREPEKD